MQQHAAQQPVWQKRTMNVLGGWTAPLSMPKSIHLIRKARGLVSCCPFSNAWLCAAWRWWWHGGGGLLASSTNPPAAPLRAIWTTLECRGWRHRCSHPPLMPNPLSPPVHPTWQNPQTPTTFRLLMLHCVLLFTHSSAQSSPTSQHPRTPCLPIRPCIRFGKPTNLHPLLRPPCPLCPFQNPLPFPLSLPSLADNEDKILLPSKQSSLQLKQTLNIKVLYRHQSAK